jgi:hypothetical protein
MKPFTAPAWNAHATFATSVLGILRDFGDPAAQENLLDLVLWAARRWNKKKMALKLDRKQMPKQMWQNEYQKPRTSETRHEYKQHVRIQVCKKNEASNRSLLILPMIPGHLLILTGRCSIHLRMQVQHLAFTIWQEGFKYPFSIRVTCQISSY